jgi:hypothetical protein
MVEAGPEGSDPARRDYRPVRRGHGSAKFNPQAAFQPPLGIFASTSSVRFFAAQAAS